MKPASPQRGFTLLELSVALIVIALVTGMAVSSSIGVLSSVKLSTTQKRMAAIDKALMAYRIANDRLPCPADLTIAAGGTNFGVEGATPGTCTGGTPSANHSAAGITNTSATAAEGAVPVVTLGLPNDDMVDGWGTRFRYAVDVSMTALGAFPGSSLCTATGAITVNDAKGLARTTGAIYALISQGANGHGAYTSNGVTVNAGSKSVDELTNCHCTSAGVYNGSYAPLYVQKLPQYDSGQTGNPLYYFDDLVSFRERWQMRADWDAACANKTSKYVYVTDQTNCTLQKFDTSGHFIWKTGSCGSGNGQFGSNGASGIAQDASGNLWVADGDNERVMEFNSSGTYITSFGSYGTGNGRFSDPQAIVINSSGTMLVSDYASSSGPCRIEEFNSSGSYLSKFSSIGSGNGNCQDVSSIAFDPSGNIWVTDYYNYRMEEFNSSGSYLGQIDNNIESWGMAVDSSGNLWETTNDGSNTINEYNTGGTLLKSIGGTGSGNGQFNEPDVIAIDSGGNLWITDDGNYRVQELNSSGSFIQKFGSQGTGNGQFEAPNYIYVGTQ